jgi:hypothetical protein
MSDEEKQKANNPRTKTLDLNGGPESDRHVGGRHSRDGDLPRT